jgi:hypothetical protein
MKDLSRRAGVAVTLLRNPETGEVFPDALLVHPLGSLFVPARSFFPVALVWPVTEDRQIRATAEALRIPENVAGRLLREELSREALIAEMVAARLEETCTTSPR